MTNGNQPMIVTSFICPDGCLWTGGLLEQFFLNLTYSEAKWRDTCICTRWFQPCKEKHMGGIACTYIHIYIYNRYMHNHIFIFIYTLSLHTRQTYVIMNLKWCSFDTTHQIGQLETNHAASPRFSGLCGSEHESAKINGLKPVWYIYIYIYTLYIYI